MFTIRYVYLRALLLTDRHTLQCSFWNIKPTTFHQCKYFLFYIFVYYNLCFHILKYLWIFNQWRFWSISCPKSLIRWYWLTSLVVVYESRVRSTISTLLLVEIQDSRFNNILLCSMFRAKGKRGQRKCIPWHGYHIVAQVLFYTQGRWVLNGFLFIYLFLFLFSPPNPLVLGYEAHE